jgi:hypothetical protein
MIDEEQAGPPVEDLLDGIPGAFERAQGAREQARRGAVVPLEELDAVVGRARDKS